MICLRCGWCCTHIWPGNHNDELPESTPCPELTFNEIGLATCRIYSTRPSQCKNEHMGAGEGEYCPIGIQALDAGKIPRPSGKCIQCGGLVYSGGGMFCCEEHEKLAIKSLGGR